MHSLTCIKSWYNLCSVAYYPPCSMPDRVLGLSPHSDKGSLAILMQEEDVVGLQIKHKGKWVPINPLANAFIVNVGDIIGVTEHQMPSLTKTTEFPTFTGFKQCNVLTSNFHSLRLCFVKYDRYGVMGSTRALNTEW